MRTTLIENLVPKLMFVINTVLVKKNIFFLLFRKFFYEWKIIQNLKILGFK